MITARLCHLTQDRAAPQLPGCEPTRQVADPPPVPQPPRVSSVEWEGGRASVPRVKGPSPAQTGPSQEGVAAQPLTALWLASP